MANPTSSDESIAPSGSPVEQVRAALQAGIQHQLEGNIPQAVSCYRMVLKRLPANPDALHLMGLAAQASGAPDLARQMLEAATRNDPSVGQYWISLASFYRSLGREAEANKARQRAGELVPDDADPDEEPDLGLFSRLLVGQGETDRLPPLVQNLACPECHASALDMVNEQVFCHGCGRSYRLIEDGIPVFVPRDGSVGSSGFTKQQQALDSRPRFLGRLRLSIGRFSRPFLGMVAWALVAVYLRRLARGLEEEVDTSVAEAVDACDAFGYRAAGLYSAIGRYMAFANSPLAEWRVDYQAPSFEIGGNWGRFTNLILAGRERITYSAEYFEDVFRGVAEDPTIQHQAVFDQLLVSFAQKLPFRTGGMATGIAMNILHHVVNIEETMAEVARVLRPGGMFYTANLAHDVYDRLPDFILLRRLGLLTRAYREWRLHRPNFAENTAYVRGGAYPNGLNQLSLDEWRSLADAVGMNLELVVPYSRKFLATLMLDLRYKGLEVPAALEKTIRRYSTRIAQEDVRRPPAFEDAYFVLLGFRRR